MASALIPLSMDDSGVEEQASSSEQRDHYSVAICMSQPWLAFCGFTITFSALFSKTMRVRRIMRSGQQFRRAKVAVSDVMIPFAILFALNVIILTLWTALDPMTYVRLDHPGLDGWNRVISSYGMCQSENVTPFLVPLALVNFLVLAIANWQAFSTRHIGDEFSESKFIALAMASLLQTFVISMPVLFIVRTSPRAFYLVLSFMIFLISTTLLLLIFGPKAVQIARLPERDQRMVLQLSIQNSSQFNHSSSMNFGTGRASRQEERCPLCSKVPSAQSKPAVVEEETREKDSPGAC